LVKTTLYKNTKTTNYTLTRLSLQLFIMGEGQGGAGFRVWGLGGFLTNLSAGSL
jgi:hypothetical protein